MPSVSIHYGCRHCRDSIVRRYVFGTTDAPIKLPKKVRFEMADIILPPPKAEITTPKYQMELVKEHPYISRSEIAFSGPGCT